ncbi:STAS domain-containing protein [Saccharothrix xinjiangensis]|uniref:Anti-sigma factor antagonist n=1 Tax=Saccharothrix xinjiangensis TaxID=204798 RepID=A0ABV9Y680_9PSEU
MGDIRTTITPATGISAGDQWGVPVVGLVGEVDMACEDPVRTALAGQLDRRTAGLVLDLTEVDFFGSTGVRLLVEACGRAEQQGTTIAVATTRRSVLRTLEMTRVDQLVDIRPTVPDALAALRCAGVPPPRRTASHR